MTRLTQRTMRLNEVNADGHELWVLNSTTKRKNGGRDASVSGRGQIPLSVYDRNGNIRAEPVLIPESNIAFNLGVQASVDSLLNSESLRAALSKGLFIILTPEYARQINTGPSYDAAVKVLERQRLGHLIDTGEMGDTDVDALLDEIRGESTGPSHKGGAMGQASMTGEIGLDEEPIQDDTDPRLQALMQRMRASDSAGDEEDFLNTLYTLENDMDAEEVNKIREAAKDAGMRSIVNFANNLLERM